MSVIRRTDDEDSAHHGRRGGRGVFAELAVQAGFLVADLEDVLKDNTYIS